MPRKKKITRRSTVNNVGSLLGDDEADVQTALGGAVVFAAATGLGVWTSLKARAVAVTQTADRQIYLEKAAVGYPRFVWWLFVAVTVVGVIVKLGTADTLECHSFCEGGYCGGMAETAANTTSAECTTAYITTPRFNPRVFLTAIPTHNTTAFVSITHRGTTLSRQVSGTHPTPLGWFTDTGSALNLTLTSPPDVNIVLLHSTPAYIVADLTLRVLSALASILLICLLIKRFDHSVARTGPAMVGVSQSLSIWFIILLLGWFVQCNVFFFMSQGSTFPTYIEEYGTSFNTYALYAFCIFILRICYVGMSIRTRPIIQTHIYPAAYLTFSIVIHIAASIAAQGPPFSATMADSKQMQRPVPPTWVLIVAILYHGVWFLWALTTAVAVMQRVSVVPYTPFAAYVLLFRWFTYVAAVHVVVQWGLELHLVLANDTYTLPFRPSLSDVLATAIFVVFMLLGVLPLPREEPTTPLPPITPRGSWRTSTWSQELVDALPTADRRSHSYYFGTIRQWRTWTHHIEHGIRPPPMFCLELADWLWAIAWEVHASDQRMMYHWRHISMCEAAALAAVPQEFSAYARRYADEGLLRTHGTPASPETPATKWYEEARVQAAPRFNISSPGTPLLSLSRDLRQSQSLLSPASPLSTVSSRVRLRLQASGYLEQTDADPLHMKGHDKAQVIMDWEKFGVKPMPVVARGYNQACVSHARDGIAIAFRGTLNLDNVKSDLQACMDTTQPDNLSGLCNEVLKVHSGFLTIWNKYLRKDVVVQVMHLMCTEHAMYENCSRPWRDGGPTVGKPHRPILITGHSLGGALAVLCAYDLKQQVVGQLDELLWNEVDGRKCVKLMWAEGFSGILKKAAELELGVDDVFVEGSDSSEESEGSQPTCDDEHYRSMVVYTFGSPRVGNKYWKHAYNEVLPHTFRVVNGEDLVPHLPPSTGRIGGWSHVGKLVVISTQGDLRIDPNTADRKLAYSPLLPWQRTLNDHRMGAYREALLAVAYARNLARAVRFVDDCIQEEQSSTTGAMVMQQLIQHQRGEAWDVARHRRGMPVIPDSEGTPTEDRNEPYACPDNMEPAFLG